MERFLLFVALGCGIAFGQAPPPTGSLTGKVVDATTKAGIRKATVYVTLQFSAPVPGEVVRYTPPTTYSGVTDDGGMYRIAGLPPGPVGLRAEKAGHLPGTISFRERIAIISGQETTAEELTLIKQGIIAGRVTDGDGEPVERANVIAIPVSRIRRPGSSSGGQAMTDDRGEFRIPRLDGGAYKLLATKPTNNFAITTAAAPGEPAMVNSPTYFPSAREQATASVVTVASGEERSGIEIRLQQTVAVRVAGRVTGEAGTQPGVNVTLQSFDGPRSERPSTYNMGMNNWNTMAAPDGRFVFANVIPGEYIATANLHRGGPDQMLSGMTRVRIGQQDVDQLTIQIQPMARITGRAVAEGGAKLPYPQVNLGVSIAEPGFRGGGGGPVKPDGTFTIENLQRVRMKLNPIAAPRGWYLKAVSVGGQRQPALEFDLTAGDTAIEVVYSNKPGTVEVTVDGLTAESGPLAVVALPDGGTGLPPLTNLYKSVPVRAGQNVFKIEDVPPGNYQIALGPLAVLDALGDPAIWEKLKTKAVRVKVEEGVTVPAAPRLILESDVEEK